MGYLFHGVGEELVLWGLFVGVECSYCLVFVSRPGGTRILGTSEGGNLGMLYVFTSWIFLEEEGMFFK